MFKWHKGYNGRRRKIRRLLPQIQAAYDNGDWDLALDKITHANELRQGMPYNDIVHPSMDKLWSLAEDASWNSDQDDLRRWYWRQQL